MFSTGSKTRVRAIAVSLALLVVTTIPSANATPSKAAAKSYAKTYMKDTYGWGEKQYACLVRVYNYESHWNYKAKNGRYWGIPQLNSGFVRHQGYSKSQFMSSYKVQIRVGLKYIKNRHHTPCNAWHKIKKHGSY